MNVNRVMKMFAIGIAVFALLISVAFASGLLEVLTHNYYWTDGTFNGWPQVTSGWSMHVVTGGNNFAQFKNTNTTNSTQGDLLCSDQYNVGANATYFVLNSDFNDMSVDPQQGYIQYGFQTFNNSTGLLEEFRPILYNTADGTWIHLNSDNIARNANVDKVSACYWVRTYPHSTVKFRVRLPDLVKFVP